MKKVLFLAFLVTLAFSDGILTRSDNGFIMKPIVPKVCYEAPIKETSTGFLFTGRIIWGEPLAGDTYKAGDPYANGLVFVSEKGSREWEYVGKTDDNGTFSLSIEPYKGFRLYAWDGSNKTLAMYDGHFYYNSELKNLYQTPTGGEPKITEKGDVVVEVDN